MEVQSVLFSADNWTPARARAWLARHDYTAPKIDRTENYLRVRQIDPSAFNRKTFRTIHLGDGIAIVVGVRKK